MGAKHTPGPWCVSNSKLIRVVKSDWDAPLVTLIMRSL